MKSIAYIAMRKNRYNIMRFRDIVFLNEVLAARLNSYCYILCSAWSWKINWQIRYSLDELSDSREPLSKPNFWKRASLTNGILCKHVDQKYGYNENKSPALDAAVEKVIILPGVRWKLCVIQKASKSRILRCLRSNISLCRKMLSVYGDRKEVIYRN